MTHDPNFGDELIETLRDAADQYDAPPSNLIPIALAGYDLTRIEQQFAELVEDTAIDAPLTGVRDEGDGPRLMSFATTDAQLELQIEMATRTIIGNLDPAQAGSIVVERVDGSTEAVVDEAGRFQVDIGGTSPFRLVARSLTGDVLVVTPWVLP